MPKKVSSQHIPFRRHDSDCSSTILHCTKQSHSPEESALHPIGASDRAQMGDVRASQDPVWTMQRPKQVQLVGTYT